MAGEHSSFDELRKQRENEPGFAEAYEAARLRLELGLSVVKLRQQRGWSQRRLARAAGIRESVLDDLELGGLIPPTEVLERVAKTLDAKLEMRLMPRNRSAVASGPTAPR